jgi:hypothetical protein
MIVLAITLTFMLEPNMRRQYQHGVWCVAGRRRKGEKWRGKARGEEGGEVNNELKRKVGGSIRGFCW